MTEKNKKDEKLKAPPKTLKIGDTELVMSWGMKQEILKFINWVPGVDIQQIMMDQSLQSLIIRRLFTETKKPIEKVDELVNIFDIDLDDDQNADVLAWVIEHLMYFFVTSLGEVSRLGEKYKDLAKTLPSSSPSENG